MWADDVFFYNFNYANKSYLIAQFYNFGLLWYLYIEITVIAIKLFVR